MFPIIKLIIIWLACISVIHSYKNIKECHTTDVRHTESDRSDNSYPDKNNYEDLDTLPIKKTPGIETFQEPTSLNNPLNLVEPGKLQDSNESTSSSALVAMSVSVAIVAILIIILSIVVLVNLD